MLTNSAAQLGTEDFILESECWVRISQLHRGVTNEQAAETVPRHVGMDFIDLPRIAIPEKVLRLVARNTARNFRIEPIRFLESVRPVIATSALGKVDASESFRHLLSYELEFVCASKEAIRAAHQALGRVDYHWIEEVW